MRTTTLSRTVLVAALALGAATLSGCSAITGALSGEDDVFSLKVGDCANDYGDDTQISTIPKVDCSKPHDTEFYFAHNLDGDDFPGDSEISAQANDVCTDAFEDFIGISYEDSTLYYSMLYPTEDSWGGGDREVLCGVYKFDEDTQTVIKVTGSLKGAAE